MYLCRLEKGLGIHQGSGKLLIHEQGDVSDHFLPTAQVEIVGAGWKMFFEIVGNSTVKTVFYCPCLVRRFCQARDIQTSSAPKEVLVVEVGGCSHPMQQSKLGHSGTAYGEKGSDAGAGGDKDRRSLGGAIGEIPIGAGETELCANFSCREHW